MKYLDLTFADPSANLACDEALLELFEREQLPGGCLRVWQPKGYFVVLGHANRLRSEVNLEACKKNRIPILRRISGGGAILQGPGILNYSLILGSRDRRLRNISAAFNFVLRRHGRLFKGLCGAQARINGVSDLTLADRKFSGNAQYRKSTCVLVHGTFLLSFDLRLIAHCLLMPSKQPDYRRNRSHLEFITNLNIDAARLCAGLRYAWNAHDVMCETPLARIHALVRERYSSAAWTEKF